MKRLGVDFGKRRQLRESERSRGTGEPSAHSFRCSISCLTPHRWCSCRPLPGWLLVGLVIYFGSMRPGKLAIAEQP
ncbi:MAG: hypothetical protein ACREX4_08050 [Gammaproteobacteria bacterium]